MRACGTGLRKSFVCSIRGSTRSSAYFNSPVHFTFASTFGNGFPTTRKPCRLDPLLPAINALLGGFGLLASDPCGSQFHGFVDLDVAGAAANISAQGFLDFVAGRPRGFL